MARLSDVIEEFIKGLLDENDSTELEIGRNELASQFRCAPSQITYVLTTRFSTHCGYYVESRRGGGGFIRIKKIESYEDESLLKLMSEKIGNNITYDAAYNIIDTLVQRELITNREASIMKISINDRVIVAPVEQKNFIRAEILKLMMKAILL